MAEGHPRADEPKPGPAASSGRLSRRRGPDDNRLMPRRVRSARSVRWRSRSGRGLALERAQAAPGRRPPPAARRRGARTTWGWRYSSSSASRTPCRAFRRALEADPTLSAAQVNLAIAHFYVPDVPAAKQAAQKALEAAPAAPHPNYLLALVARSEGQAEQALPHLQQVLAVDPDGPRGERHARPGVPAAAPVRGRGGGVPRGARRRALQRERRLQPRPWRSTARTGATRASRRWRASSSCATARTRRRSARTTSSRDATPRPSPRPAPRRKPWTRRRRP